MRDSAIPAPAAVSSAFSTRCGVGTVYPDAAERQFRRHPERAALFPEPSCRRFQNYWANTLLRPRIHVGGNLATGSDPINQVYAGLTWHFPVYDPFFLEASFGGTWHDGPLESPGDGLDLGCHWLFRESLALGVDLGEHWRVLASADHSSHAHLCDGGKAGNSGITHAGVYAGYRF